VRLLRGLVLLLSGCAAVAAEPAFAPVVPGHTLEFPRDYGSHPAFRTEWWYVTGWLDTADGETLGFQITFFRTKPDSASQNPSAFAPNQILIAHCALSDPKRGRLWQDQRIRRAGLGLAGAAEGDTKVWIEKWSLVRDPEGYVATLQAEAFSLQFQLEQVQPPIPNGDHGFSRKGPGAAAASYYYSVPHMKVHGTISRESHIAAVTGEAWFDHEWSSEYLDAQATGWDWIGVNLNDGGALMAFRIRGSDGNARWAGGTLRAAEGQMRTFGPDDIRFQVNRHWVSPRTGVSYPVEITVRAGERSYLITPLIDDQENDTRLSTGAIYWEGAVRAVQNDTQVGRGYLELTGYGERLQLR
jgi:predicted secreted hydrolase